MLVPKNKKVFFFSDFHLGIPSFDESRNRELYFIDFLNKITKDTHAIFIMGDLFDFWYEYRTVVPKGYIRLLGKLATLTDSGISIYFFVGNHDMWMRDYLQRELNIPVFFKPQEFKIDDNLFYLAHGDGLGKADYGYKFLKKILTSRLFNAFFKLWHPDIGVSIAQYLSKGNSFISGDSDATFLGEDNEWLIQHSISLLKDKPFKYFIYGHRHLPIRHDIENAVYINLGDWITHFTYAVYSNNRVELKSLKRDCS